MLYVKVVSSRNSQAVVSFSHHYTSTHLKKDTNIEDISTPGNHENIPKQQNNKKTKKQGVGLGREGTKTRPWNLYVMFYT